MPRTDVTSGRYTVGVSIIQVIKAGANITAIGHTIGIRIDIIIKSGAGIIYITNTRRVPVLDEGP